MSCLLTWSLTAQGDIVSYTDQISWILLFRSCGIQMMFLLTLQHPSHDRHIDTHRHAQSHIWWSGAQMYGSHRGSFKKMMPTLLCFHFLKLKKKKFLMHNTFISDCRHSCIQTQERCESISRIFAWLFKMCGFITRHNTTCLAFKLVGEPACRLHKLLPDLLLVNFLFFFLLSWQTNFTASNWPQC